MDAHTSSLIQSLNPARRDSPILPVDPHDPRPAANYPMSRIKEPGKQENSRFKRKAISHLWPFNPIGQAQRASILDDELDICGASLVCRPTLKPGEGHIYYQQRSFWEGRNKRTVIFTLIILKLPPTSHNAVYRWGIRERSHHQLGSLELCFHSTSHKGKFNRSHAPCILMGLFCSMDSQLRQRIYRYCPHNAIIPESIRHLSRAHKPDHGPFR